MPECAVCSSPAPHKCARCKCVFYCSPAHQKEDWPVHKVQCPRLAQEALAAVFHPCDEELLLRITTCLAQNGYYKEVKIMVQLNKAFWWDEQIWDALKDVHGDGKWGRTRLMYAAIKDDLERVRFLLDRGARVNKVCVHDGTTAMMLTSHLTVVRLLCGRGGNVDAVRTNGRTALMRASQLGFLEITRELCKRGANVNAATITGGANSLVLASQNGHLEVVRELCKRGANVNAACLDTYGLTALMWASTEGHIAIVRELCDWGANVNAACTDDGTTSLMWASQEGHLEVVRELCERKANIDATMSTCGGSAVMWASWEGHTEVVRELCARQCSLSISTTGVDPEANTTPGMTPLMIAARDGHKGTVAALLSCGADPSAKDDQGMTAHSFAVTNGHTAVCELLV